MNLLPLSGLSACLSVCSCPISAWCRWYRAADTNSIEDDDELERKRRERREAREARLRQGSSVLIPTEISYVHEVLFLPVFWMQDAYFLNYPGHVISFTSHEDTKIYFSKKRTKALNSLGRQAFRIVCFWHLNYRFSKLVFISTSELYVFKIVLVFDTWFTSGQIALVFYTWAYFHKTL